MPTILGLYSVHCITSLFMIDCLISVPNPLVHFYENGSVTQKTSVRKAKSIQLRASVLIKVLLISSKLRPFGGYSVYFYENDQPETTPLEQKGPDFGFRHVDVIVELLRVISKI